MAQAKTFKFSDIVMMLGDGALPELFAAPCGLTQNTMTISTNSNETVIPDCDDPDLAAWAITDILSLKMELGGQGILDIAARPVWEDWAMSGLEKNVRFIYGVTLANFGGYYAAPAVLTNYQVTSQRGNRATLQTSIVFNGKPLWVPASA